MKRIHLIGIGGTGMSSIARVLLEKGYTVTGSDRALSPLALDLKLRGAHVFEGHAAENIQGADLVVRSSAIPDSNVEVIAARAAGIAVLKRSDFLGSLLSDHYSIAVAGSHGKTTTTAMLAHVLTQLGEDPSYIIGGVSKDLASNAHAGQGKFFVIEADEYDRMFMGLKPNLVLLTNVEYDHPDCYPTPADYLAAFSAFLGNIQPQGLLIACSDYSNTAALLSGKPASLPTLTYALSAEANIQARNCFTNLQGGFDYDLFIDGCSFGRVSLLVPGEHNVRNSLGVLAALHALDLDLTRAITALAHFTGTGRRFDVLGEANGVVVVDDYAHHPSKILATLSAARSKYPHRRLVAVWQPHTYSRTKALAQDFIQSLSFADQVIVTEVYPAREPIEAFSSASLVAQMPAQKAYYCKTLPETTALVEKILLPGDVLLVLSAGDADQVSHQVYHDLQERKS
jgi:UDP-N-acetylmuramate--alanine ligase